MRLLFLWLLTIGLLYGGSREALLVGNSDYDYISDLKNPKSSMKKLKKLWKVWVSVSKQPITSMLNTSPLR